MSTPADISVRRRRPGTARLEIQVFTILAVLYYILNMVFPTDYSLDAKNPNRIYPQIVAGLLTLNCLWSILPSIRFILKNRVLRIFLAFLALAVLYVIYPMDPVANIMYVMRTYMAIIAMLALYSMLIRVKDDRFWTKHVFVIFAFQVIFSLFALVSDKLGQTTELIEQFDSNAGFTLVTCLPMALLIPRKRMRVYVYLLLVAACLYSGQRSAALAALASFPLALGRLRRSVTKKDLTLILTLGMLVLVPVLVEAFLNIQARNAYDLDRGDMGSGRLIFWLIVIQDFFRHGPLNLVFGNGTNSVVHVLERYYGLAIGAHNGWLDVLYTFGFAGVAVYAMTIISMLRRNRIVKRRMPQYKGMYLILVVIFFIKSATSHGYYDIDVMPFLTVVALIEGNMDRRIIKKKTGAYEETGNN